MRSPFVIAVRKYHVVASGSRLKIAPADSSAKDAERPVYQASVRLTEEVWIFDFCQILPPVRKFFQNLN
jgi:hypothetical protein